MGQDFIAWILLHYKVFVLVLVRVSTMFFMMPIFDSRTIPMTVKACISLMLAWCLAPVVHLSPDIFPVTTLGFFILVLQEVLVGIILSLLLKLVFAGLQVAGQMVGVQMGLSVANIMDPQTGVQSVIVAQFAYMIALLLFLVANGHHAILRALYESFEILPPGTLVLNGTLYKIVMLMGHEMFVLSIKLMAPVMAILFLSQVGLGILAKLVPQINMLMVSFSLNVALGLFFFGLTLQFFWPVLARSLNKAVHLLPLALRAMGG
ncbi:MAG: flagellar biosynthetic protein FliR [Thermodesulfobacteria bacterium]|nr:flagellar biosynthetic protein FliR [Thermodesulfobacteriota bacterium]